MAVEQELDHVQLVHQIIEFSPFLQQARVEIKVTGGLNYIQSLMSVKIKGQCVSGLMLWGRTCTQSKLSFLKSATAQWCFYTLSSLSVSMKLLVNLQVRRPHLYFREPYSIDIHWYVLYIVNWIFEYCTILQSPENTILHNPFGSIPNGSSC